MTNQKKNGAVVQALAGRLRDEVKRAFVGDDATIDTVLVGFLTGLNVLIEDIPGVGKTTLARSLASASGLDFARIQFSPDLLPGDITGVTVWSQERREFVFKPGAIMRQFVLADELNRASARTQSALLESMQEQSVTVDGTTYDLPQPFFLIATQNPLQFAGTFRLPEGQLDRFGLSVSFGYPTTEQEIAIMDLIETHDPLASLAAVVTPDEIATARETTRSVRVHREIKRYLVAIAERTRRNRHVRLGMSPRASGHLLHAAQGRAAIQGRDFVIPEDVKAVASPALRHRLILSPEARMEEKNPARIVEEVLEAIPLPTGLS
ncbi:MAG: AAA family ATPase [Spirochaetota bacterium]